MALLGSLRPAAACCTVYPADRRVAIVDQEILIVWDAKNGLERFVRRAAFETPGGRDFGFLVPTPSVPALAEVPNAVFDRLRQATRPRVVTGYRIDVTPLVLYPFTLFLSSAADRPAGALVRVLHQQSVAGYDAAVLEADDAVALARWLRAHGYDSRPEIEEWAKPYVAAHWKITAFKYAQAGAPAEERTGSAAATATTGAVSLSFATDRPLFPYRVPTDQLAMPGQRHLLRVFFVGTERMEAALGKAGKPWAGVARYAGRVEGLRSLLAGVAPDDALPAAGWITMFEDDSWPGGTKDLFFRRATEAGPIRPVVQGRPARIPRPLDVLAFVAVGCFRILRRRSAAVAAPPH